MLSTVYPEIKWEPWKLLNTVWSDNSNHKKFAEFAEQQLKINDKSDWYKVTFQVSIATNKRPIKI